MNTVREGLFWVVSLRSQDSHLEFIKINWSNLAALAWAGYNQFGRGALFLLERHINCGKTEVGYAAAADMLKAVSSSLALCSMINDYNPEREIIVAVARRNNTFSAYCASTKPWPRVAWEREQRSC